MKHSTKKTFVILTLLLSLILCTSNASHAAGTVAFQARYTPFGESITESGTLARDVQYTFTGQERDADLAMLDYGARFYDPRLGRFKSIDPIDHPGESPYAYVGNNPLRYVDPTGKQGSDPSLAMNIVKYAQQIVDTMESAVRGWAQENLAHWPMFNLQPNPQDIQAYHTVAAAGLLTAAVLTAVEWGVTASDPTGSVTGSMTSTGETKIKASSPYGSVAVGMGPEGLSSSGSLKAEKGPLTVAVDSDGNPSLKVRLGDTNVGMSSNGTASLVVKGTGAKANAKTGKTTISAKAGILGVSATVDPEKTKGLVDRALHHINQLGPNRQYTQQEKK